MTGNPCTPVYVALGSNLGDRALALERARNWMRRIAKDERIEESAIYETLPVGPGSQDCHLNQVVRFETRLSSSQLLFFFKEVESWLGRRVRPRMHPREIDIDLLFFGSEDINLPQIRVPHVGWAARSFVLVPLLDLDPDFHCPVTGISGRALLDEHCPLWQQEAWVCSRRVEVAA